MCGWFVTYEYFLSKFSFLVSGFCLVFRLVLLFSVHLFANYLVISKI